MTAGLCSPWTTVEEVAACCEEVQVRCDLEEMVTLASEALWALSGRVFGGTCETTVRPCWSSRSCGCDASGCGCSGAEVVLPGATVVTEVLVDGEELEAEGEWRLDPGGRLVRLADENGRGRGWPCCQRLDLPTTERGTWQITFDWGLEPPDLGRRAAAVLACELGKACHPSTAKDCRLPQKTTSLTRQGVTIQLSDPTALLDKGRTGIYEVDLFLASYNPSQLRRPPRVASPDIPPHRLVN